IVDGTSDDAELTLSAVLGAGTSPVNVPLLRAVPIQMVADPVTGALSAQVVVDTLAAGFTGLSTAQIDTLRQAGVTRFRYYFSDAAAKYAPGKVTVSFVADRWGDVSGNLGLAGTRTFNVNGPTGDLSNPQGAGSI